MRPTTKRRVIILAVSAVLSSAALTGVYQFRQYQINTKTMAYRAEGMEAFRQGDYARALIPLSKYNERRQTDVETLFAFGKARSRVEVPGDRHLIEAIGYFRRGLELEPGNMAARHELLELYSDAGYNGEAIALADELLKKDAKDVAALRAKAKALTYRRQYADAFATAVKVNELAPLDVEGQLLTLRLMSPWCLNKPAEEILARAKAALDAHPGDPRFVLIQGYAYHCVLDDTKAKEQYLTAKDRYLEAAQTSPKDPEFVKVCTGLMDGVGLFDESQKLLEQASADGADPRMVRMLVQRLWQNGRYKQVVDRLKDLDPTTTASDSHLLAYRAFSLYELPSTNPAEKAEHARQAKRIVEALGARKDDDVALAWAKALTAKFEDPAGNPRDKIQQYQAALVRDPGNAVIRHLMGEAYARLGETELALQSWALVTRAIPSWPTPRVEMAYLLASTGRTQTAIEQAAAAYAAGQNLGSAIGLVVALATQLDAGNGQQPNVARVLELSKEIQEKVPGEPQTLPIYVNLLAKTGDKDKAIAAVRDAIDKGHPIGTDAWLRLAAVSRSQKLGLERVIMDHAKKAHGETPKVALANAVLMSEAGDAKGATAYLTAAASKATADQAAWKTVVAQFLEHVRDPRAHDAWVELGDQFPEELSVQGAIIDLSDASTAWADRPFIERTIQRLKALTGDQGFHWQLARARWLLNSDNKERDSAEAVVTLGDIVRNSPGLVVPRVYLARAMENVGNPSAAIEQLRSAAEMDRGNVGVALDLVRLYQAEGKFADAKVYLDRAAQSAVDPRSRQRLAQFYSRQGDLDAAVKVLGPAAAAGGDGDAATAALVADLHRRRGDFDEAMKLYERVAAGPDADAQALASAADFFASRGKKDQARTTLDRLSKMTMPAGHREVILAEYNDRHESKKTAEGLYRQAVEAAPTDPAIWRQLVTFQFRQNQFQQAAATCDAALAKIPGNEDLLGLKNTAAALAGGNGSVDTAALIAEASKDPRNAALRDSLATYEEIRKNGDAPDRAAIKMRRVADQYPRFLPVQTQVVRMYVQLGKVDDAIAVAARAMDNFPNDPEPAGLTSMVYAGVGRWNDALTTAREWRRRSLENPVQADLMIARARLELRQPGEAMGVLKPYLEQARQDPDKYNMVIGTYAHALIADGKESDAAALLKPHLSRSEEWAVSSLRLASLVRPAGTAQWIEQFAAGVPADSVKGHYEVANAWYTAAMRPGLSNETREAYLAKAGDAITPLTRRPDATPVVLLMAGSIAENRGQKDVAIDAYRRALRLDPKQPLAQNNLAYLLMTEGKDLDEARELAERAVAASPREWSYHDTLAHIYLKAGNRDRAIATFEKVLALQPTNAEAKTMLERLQQNPTTSVQEVRQQL
jgi:tetratricopeptide (TPR) repeat protein